MSLVKRIKREIKNNHYTRVDIEHTPYGSLISSILKLTNHELTDAEYIKRFKKSKLPFMEDPQFIVKTVMSVIGDIVNYEADVVGLPLCVCESPKGVLIHPYIVENGDIGIVALQKGHHPFTVQYALANDTYKIIDWTEEGGETLFEEEVGEIKRKELVENEDGSYDKV